MKPIRTGPLRGMPSIPGGTALRTEPPASSSSVHSVPGPVRFAPGRAGNGPEGNPGDATGRAGAAQYVQWNGTALSVFDKATGALLCGPIAAGTLFRSLGGACATRTDGHPGVEFDTSAGRWILSHLIAGATPGDGHRCVAVSATRDATGSYDLYDIVLERTRTSPDLTARAQPSASHAAPVAPAQCTPGGCDDNDPCTDDTCDPVMGCIHTPTNCDDGDVCTVDSCSPTGAPGVATLFIGHDISQLERQYQKIGTFVQTWGAIGQATGAAIDANGVVYICNPAFGANVIEKRGPGNTNLGTITATVNGQWIEDLGNYGGGYILASTYEGNIFRIDTSTGAHTLLFSTGQTLIGVTYDGTNIWTTGGSSTNLVYRRDFAGNILASFNTGQTNGGIGYDPDDGTLWIGHPNGQVTHHSQAGTLLGGFDTAAGGGYIDGVELANLPLPPGCRHNAIDCNDNDPCTDDACDPMTGCYHPPHGCDDTNPCTDDACATQSGCVHTDNTAPCDDSDVCTTGDTCSGGLCQPGAPVACDDNNVCTTDTCDPRFGCTHVDNTDPCDDGNPCTIEDACLDGTCHPGVPVDCDDGNPCTVDACDPATGCAYTNTSGPCEDGNPCTTGDACSNGACQPGAPLVCTPSDPCHLAGVCEPVTGACSNPPAPNGTPCTDGNACTQGDFCEAGTCFGGNPVTCAASDQCHAAGACDPATGVCSNPAQPDGTACNDGNPCTAGDVCTGGVCAGSGTIAVPVETQDLALAADRSTVRWSPVSDATSYDVVRGNLGALPVGSSAGGEVCFDDLSAPEVVDTATPVTGAGFWYLSRARNPCGPGPLGTQSDGTARVTTTCP